MMAVYFPHWKKETYGIYNDSARVEVLIMSGPGEMVTH